MGSPSTKYLLELDVSRDAMEPQGPDVWRWPHPTPRGVCVPFVCAVRFTGIRPREIGVPFWRTSHRFCPVGVWTRAPLALAAFERSQLCRVEIHGRFAKRPPKGSHRRAENCCFLWDVLPDATGPSWLHLQNTSTPQTSNLVISTWNHCHKKIKAAWFFFQRYLYSVFFHEIFTTTNKNHRKNPANKNPIPTKNNNSPSPEAIASAFAKLLQELRTDGEGVTKKMARPGLIWRCVPFPFFFLITHTLRKTNIAPENGPSQKATSIPTINFQVFQRLWFDVVGFMYCIYIYIIYQDEPLSYWFFFGFHNCFLETARIFIVSNSYDLVVLYLQDRLEELLLPRRPTCGGCCVCGCVLSSNRYAWHGTTWRIGPQDL